MSTVRSGRLVARCPPRDILSAGDDVDRRPGRRAAPLGQPRPGAPGPHRRPPTGHLHPGGTPRQTSPHDIRALPRTPRHDILALPRIGYCWRFPVGGFAVLQPRPTGAADGLACEFPRCRDTLPAPRPSRQQSRYCRESQEVAARRGRPDVGPRRQLRAIVRVAGATASGPIRGPSRVRTRWSKPVSAASTWGTDPCSTTTRIADSPGSSTAPNRRSAAPSTPVRLRWMATAPMASPPIDDASSFGAKTRPASPAADPGSDRPTATLAAPSGTASNATLPVASRRTRLRSTIASVFARACAASRSRAARAASLLAKTANSASDASCICHASVRARREADRGAAGIAELSQRRTPAAGDRVCSRA